MSEFLSANVPKFTSVFTAIAAFFIILGLIFAIAGRANGKKARPIALTIFLGPALVLLLAGVVIPGVRTILFSFMNPDSNEFIGLGNYQWMLEDPNVKTIMINTILWILVVPLFTAALGLLLAIMLDRIKHESQNHCFLCLWRSHSWAHQSSLNLCMNTTNQIKSKSACLAQSLSSLE
jgi:alpha-glucoside transport system permease protein